jgi:hypothetical protein
VAGWRHGAMVRDWFNTNDADDDAIVAGMD